MEIVNIFRCSRKNKTATACQRTSQVRKTNRSSNSWRTDFYGESQQLLYNDTISIPFSGAVGRSIVIDRNSARWPVCMAVSDISYFVEDRFLASKHVKFACHIEG